MSLATHVSLKINSGCGKTLKFSGRLCRRQTGTQVTANSEHEHPDILTDGRVWYYLHQLMLAAKPRNGAST